MLTKLTVGALGGV